MTKFVLYAGKGGVGKTTAAAAKALELANDGNLTLIVSTDPAHSLSDSFELDIGPKEKEISNNLWAIEISPEEEVEKFKDKLGKPDQPDMGGEKSEMPGAPEMPEGMPGLNPQEMRGGLSDMSSMPGMNEMAAFDLFLKYLDTAEYDYVVFDTAPTGHTLKFLSLPETMGSWVGKMLKLRMRLSKTADMFKKVLPFTEEKEQDYGLDKLEEMKKRIEKGRKALSDPEQTEFVLVTIPQEMATAETRRALDQLDEYDIPVQKIVVNQIQPENKNCQFCQERRKLHEKKLEEVKEKFKDKEIIQIELFKKEVKGNKMLQKFSEKLKQT